MREINAFSLERHSGEYQTWPLRSRLIQDGTPQALTLPGYCLLRQYATPDGYLFVTDYDCPFEEMTNFILVDKGIRRVLCERGIGRMYTSYSLDDLFWRDERNFTAILSGERFVFTIRSFHIPHLYPKLGYRWMRRGRSGTVYL